ncbi:MAG: DUF4858 domain-containing protein [Bacteroides sp.]|nr:DUF4858 domain-containing protein [Bacteroides sp.]
MNKCLSLFFFVLIIVIEVAHAQQWTSGDSIKLQRMMNGPGEIKINPKTLKQIDFGSFGGTPQISDDEPGLKWSNDLPKPKENTPKIRLTLRPYQPNTPFNYDPIRKVKYKVRSNTWRQNTYSNLKKQTVYSNWAKKPTDAGPRETLEQIEASGLRYNPINERSTERASNRSVGNWNFTPGTTNLGKSKVYTHMNGAGIGGLDFNAVFRREFWDKSIGKRRSRTLEVLRHYGDSTTVDINVPVQIIGSD